jgi:hypothetical protein
MSPELTRKLVRRFPVLYQEFYDDMRTTCMCWGFDHGDGWFHIIWQLSLALNDELGYEGLRGQVKSRWFLFKKRWCGKWNTFIYKLSPPVQDKTKMVGTGVTGDPYRRVVTEKVYPRDQWLKDLSLKLLPDRSDDFKSRIGSVQRLGLKCLVVHPNTGFAVQQVKEKFGTLRYYCSGNDAINNFVNLAGRLSSVTCEVCGRAGELRNKHGWYSTQCDRCFGTEDNKE